MTNTARRRPRRTAAQWHNIVEAQQASGLSAPKFCKEKHISYPSFMNWKKKLVNRHESSNEMQATFIELKPELDAATPSALSGDAQTVSIELDLGAGIHLRICRTG